MRDLCLCNAGAGNAEHADGCTEQQESNLAANSDQGSASVLLPLS